MGIIKDIEERIEWLRLERRKNFTEVEKVEDIDNEQASQLLGISMTLSNESEFLKELIKKHKPKTRTTLCQDCGTVCLYDWRLEYAVCPKCGSDRGITV